MIPFHRNSIGQEEADALARVALSGNVAHGKEAHAFEQEFADYIGWWEAQYGGLNVTKVRPYCIFTNSCTSALKIAYKWAKEQGLVQITYPANTFCATYSAAEEMGLKAYPRTMPGYYNTPGGPFGLGAMAVDDFSFRVNVHYGSIKDTTPCLIKDSAHRIEPNDPLVGKIRCYSFHGTKAMTTGHGGMLVTNDKEIYDYCRLVNNDGIERKENGDKATWDYEVKLMAGGYDGSDLNAAMGREQLKKLPKFMERRREILKMYNDGLGTDWQGTLFYVHFLKDKEEVGKFIDYMTEKGVGTAYHYPGAGWLGVSLPLYPSLTNEEVNYIIETVKQWK